jgi:hypothetical protein
MCERIEKSIITPGETVLRLARELATELCASVHAKAATHQQDTTIREEDDMKNSLFAAFVTLSLAVTTAWAGPTLQLNGGKTTVDLSPGFVDALVSLGVTPSRIKPGDLNLRKGTAVFPISGGAVDGESLAGDIFHTGGLTLAVPGTEVFLLNFIISTVGDDAPVLTGIASVNGDVVARIPLFNLDLSALMVDANKKKVKLGNVGLTLTDVAAATLNEVFGTDAFVEGFEIGTASVGAKIKRALGDTSD